MPNRLHSSIVFIADSVKSQSKVKYSKVSYRNQVTHHDVSGRTDLIPLLYRMLRPERLSALPRA